MKKTFIADWSANNPADFGAKTKNMFGFPAKVFSFLPIHLFYGHSVSDVEQPQHPWHKYQSQRYEKVDLYRNYKENDTKLDGSEQS